MPDYRRLVGWSREAWPYAKELFSNEIYVYVSAVAMNALFSFPPFVILMVTVSKYFLPRSGVDGMIFAILRQYLPFTDAAAPPTGRSNLMARRVLTRQLDKVKEALWIFKTESPS
jgi:uncharacterized BrkB/YihY/UPF0761 family membrane protein